MNPQSKTKVLVVDDFADDASDLISQILRSDPDIEIVGQAADPLEARESRSRRSSPTS